MCVCVCACLSVCVCVCVLAYMCPNVAYFLIAHYKNINGRRKQLTEFEIEIVFYFIATWQYINNND